METYRIPAHGALFQIVHRKCGSENDVYYLSGKLILGDRKGPIPPAELPVEIPIPEATYREIEEEMKKQGEKARVFITEGLEVKVMIPFYSVEVLRK